MIGYIEVDLPGPFGIGGGEEELMAQAGGVLTLLYHLKFRDDDTSFKLDNSSSPLGVIL
jgi:hypothetical protein